MSREVLREAHIRRVVRVVVQPGERRVVPAQRGLRGRLRDGEPAAAVVEEHDGGTASDIGDDVRLEDAIVAPMPEIGTRCVLFDTPAEAPEEISGERFGWRVEAVRAGWIHRDLW